MSFAESYLGRLRAAVGSAPLIVVGARVLIEDANARFLILKRTDDGFWGLPGGSMELGESPLDTARREAFEETGLTLGPLAPFGLSCDPSIEHHTYPNGDRIQNVSLLTHTSAVPHADPVARDGEARAFRFAHPDSIDPATFSASEFPTFAHFAAFRATGQFQVV